MISLVAKVINLFALTIQSVLHVAWLIGKVIVAVLSRISSSILNIIENVIVFFQIVYEDNVSIFTEELPNMINDISNTVTEQLVYVQHGIHFVCQEISFRIIAISGSIKWLVDSVFIIIFEVVLLFKNGTIFIGDTIWFILIFLPVHLPRLIKVVFRNVMEIAVNGVVDAYMALLKVTNFLTDVPLQSFIGITSAIVIIRLCIHFRETIQTQAVELYWSLIRKMWYYYYAFYNYFIDVEVREITRMSGGDDIGSREDIQSSAVVDDGSGADALCVICQERQKCVLTLPCRHVCLCTECCMRLYGYQRTCPICRTFIYHSVTVYL